MHYSFEAIVDAYKKLGVTKGRTVYVTGNFGRLGHYVTKEKAEVFNAHYNALLTLLGTPGTIVFPTHSFSLCNTSKPFDLEKTPSETGPFTEHLRKKSGSVRQLHPYSSSTAIGSQANYYCSENGLHVYDVQSPFHRMVEQEALFLSVGMLPQHSASLVHYVEFMMGVPYRYTKEFVHTCIDHNKVQKTQCFYLHVLYRDLALIRDRNKKIFNHYSEKASLYSEPLGRSFVHSFDMRDFVNKTSSLLKNDIYSWLSTPPEERERCYRH